MGGRGREREGEGVRWEVGNREGGKKRGREGVGSERGEEGRVSKEESE